jgi:hypothetical protein
MPKLLKCKIGLSTTQKLQLLYCWCASSRKNVRSLDTLLWMCKRTLRIHRFIDFPMSRFPDVPISRCSDLPISNHPITRSTDHRINRSRAFDTFPKPFKIDEYFPSQAPVFVWRLIQCRSGGIGRRAWFRSMYSQGCGGSSPFFGTNSFVRSQR